jgi:hypothetical protein
MVEEDGSSMTHRRDPQAFKVVLKFSQVSVESFAVGSQIPKISSMYLLKYRRLAENLGKMTVFLCCPNETIAYAHATGIPIAVPKSCSQYEPPEQKMLFSMIILRTCKNKFVGKLSGRFSELSERKFLMALMPVSVSMFVYIDVASAENSLAFYGIIMSAKFSITLYEFLM